MMPLPSRYLKKSVPCFDSFENDLTGVKKPVSGGQEAGFSGRRPFLSTVFQRLNIGDDFIVRRIFCTVIILDDFAVLID